MTLKHKAVSGFRWGSASMAVTMACSLVQAAVLARFIKPADFGLMAMAMLATSVAQSYCDLGASGAVIYRRDTTKEQLSSLFWLNVMAGAAVFAAFWLLIPLMATAFKEPRLREILMALSIVLLLSSFSKQFQVLLQKNLRFDLLARQEMIATVAGAAAGIAAAIADFQVWALVLSSLVSMLCRSALYIRAGLALHRPTLRFRTADLRGYVGFSAYQLAERTVNVIAERLDQIVIGRVLGAQALGYYSFAFNLAMTPLSRINPVFTRVAFPVFARLQDDVERLRRGYVKSLEFMVSLNAVFSVALACAAPLLVPLAFGEPWRDSVLLIQILSMVALLRSVGNPMGSLLLAKGRADLGFVWNVAFLLVTTVAVYAGGRLGAAAGIAWAVLILQVLLQAPAYCWLVRPFIGRCGREYMTAILKPAALAGLAGVISLAAYEVPCRSPISRLAIQGGVMAAATALLFMVFHRKFCIEAIGYVLRPFEKSS